MSAPWPTACENSVMSDQLNIVTIDGPSGVGKSTVSRGLAARLGYTYLDTGAMYRAVAYGCQQAGIDPGNEQAVAALLPDLVIELRPPQHSGQDVRVFLNAKEIGDFIRTPAMGMLASKVSALPAVRQKLTSMQQAMGRAGKLVAEGRDTGTVVFPTAAWKFFLDAEPEERARRRIAQLREQGDRVDETEILAQIIKRDKNDRERSIAPLQAAPDAVRIDATSMDAETVIDTMFRHITSTG